MSKFSQDIDKFNGIYKLPVNEIPTLDYLGQNLNPREAAALRLADFKDILSEEVDEVDTIIAKLRNDENYSELKVLTDLSDWLGDLQVYCASEMIKFGLPRDKILETIMQSNFSKLDANGLPIYDERGKVLKGPNYWKPEPKIEALLAEAIDQSPLKLDGNPKDSAARPFYEEALPLYK